MTSSVFIDSSLVRTPVVDRYIEKVIKARQDFLDDMKQFKSHELWPAITFPNTEIATEVHFKISPGTTWAQNWGDYKWIGTRSPSAWYSGVYRSIHLVPFQKIFPSEMSRLIRHELGHNIFRRSGRLPKKFSRLWNAWRHEASDVLQMRARGKKQTYIRYFSKKGHGQRYSLTGMARVPVNKNTGEIINRKVILVQNVVGWKEFLAEAAAMLSYTQQVRKHVTKRDKRVRKLFIKHYGKSLSEMARVALPYQRRRSARA